MTTTSGKTPVTSALLGGCAQRTAKAFLIVTDLGLLAYWTLTAVGVISVGTGDVLLAWNWSFLPLDLFAVTAGLTWSLLPTGHRWSTPLFLCALTRKQKSIFFHWYLIKTKMTKHDILSFSIHLYDSEITGFVKVKIDK